MRLTSLLLIAAMVPSAAQQQPKPDETELEIAISSDPGKQLGGTMGFLVGLSLYLAT